VQDGERSVVLNRVGDVQSVSCAYHIVAGADADYPAFDVLNDVLANQPNGRLYQSMVKTELATGISTDNPALKDPSYFYISADVLKDKSIDKAKDAMFKTIDELQTKPVTSDEVEKSKNKILKEFEEAYRNSEYIGLALSEFISQGDWRLAFLYRDNVKKVTADDVNRIIKAYFMNSNRTVGEFIPTANPVRATLPKQPDLAAIFKGYKGQQALASAEAFDPSPANIEKRTERGTTSGGAKYALLSKTTRGNSVEGRITLRLGDEKSLENKANIAALTAGMLKRGTKNKTMAQINETLDKLQSSVNIFGSGQSVTVMIKSTKANLSQTMDLVNEILHEPSFPDDELKTLKNETISQFEQERAEPQSIAFREYSRVCNPRPKGNIKYVMTVDEEVAGTNEVSIKDIKNFYKSFYNSSSATAAFVGEFDATQVKDQLNKILGPWTASVAYTRIPDPYDDVKPQYKEIKTPDKKNAMLVCGMNVKMRDDDPNYPAMIMGNFIFGGGFLNSRLATRIRQKEGISYGVGSFLQINSKDESGQFGSYAIYNPENKAKLETAWNDELDKMLKDGVTEQELKQAKAGYIQYRENGRAEDAQLVGKLNSYLFLDRTMAWDKNIDDQLQKLTPAQINTAMKKFISKEKITYVKAGDFKE
jgi:zinc protease